MLTGCLIAGILLRISYTDIRYRKIGKGAAFLLALSALVYHGNLMDSLTGALVVSGITELVNLTASGLRGIGGGDIRLLFAVGLLLGTDRGLYALLLSMLMSLGCWYLRKLRAGNRKRVSGPLSDTQWRKESGKDPDRFIPLGPFISCAAGILMLV